KRHTIVNSYNFTVNLLYTIQICILKIQTSVMIRTVICLLLLISLEQQLYAQIKSLDERAASIPNENCSNIDALASYIKFNFTTDAERIRAIYIWITNHIIYDVPLFNSIETNPDQEPQPVSKVLSER